MNPCARAACAPSLRRVDASARLKTRESTQSHISAIDTRRAHRLTCDFRAQSGGVEEER